MQQNMDYESLKKEHAEKVKKFNDLKIVIIAQKKKENAYNRKQSVSIVNEKQQ